MMMMIALPSSLLLKIVKNETKLSIQNNKKTKINNVMSFMNGSMSTISTINDDDFQPKQKHGKTNNNNYYYFNSNQAKSVYLFILGNLLFDTCFFLLLIQLLLDINNKHRERDRK